MIVGSCKWSTVPHSHESIYIGNPCCTSGALRGPNIILVFPAGMSPNMSRQDVHSWPKVPRHCTLGWYMPRTTARLLSPPGETVTKSSCQLCVRYDVLCWVSWPGKCLLLCSLVGGGEGRACLPMLLAIPPCDSPPAAHCRIRAEAARRIWPRLACALRVCLEIRVVWKKQRARSVGLEV